MLPSEMLILMAIAIDRKTGKKLISRPMDVTGEYIGYLYASLVNRGYLKGQKSSGYKLTSLGKEVILEFLHKNENRAKDIILRLRLIGIDLSPAEGHKLDKLERQAIRVK